MDDHRREQNVVSSIARSFRCTGPAFVTGDVTARAASLAAAATRFAAQDLLATTAQLAECGVTSGVLRQRLATGEWIRIERELVGIPAPMTWERRVRGAVLLGGASALVSHGTAARLHRFDGYDRFDEICLCSMGGAHIRGTAETRISRTRTVTSRHRLVTRSGIPVVSIPVALIQIAGREGRDATARALDGALRDGISPRWIRTVVDEIARSGLSGPGLLGELLHERVDRRLPRSWYQRLAKRLLAAHGLDLVDEWQVRDGTAIVASLDLAIPSLRIGVECQSWAWHAPPAAQDRDNRRKRRLRELGWELVEVWWTDLDRIGEVARDVEVAITRRRPTLPGIS